MGDGREPGLPAPLTAGQDLGQSVVLLGSTGIDPQQGLQSLAVMGHGGLARGVPPLRD